jgi:hypothetical protein
MVQTYQGYFLEDGRLMTNGSPIRLPIRRRVIVNILEDEMGETKVQSKAEKQNQSLKQFFAAIDAVEGEPITDNDLADFEKNRVCFRKEFGE